MNMDMVYLLRSKEEADRESKLSIKEGSKKESQFEIYKKANLDLKAKVSKLEKIIYGKTKESRAPSSHKKTRSMSGLRIGK